MRYGIVSFSGTNSLCIEDNCISNNGILLDANTNCFNLNYNGLELTAAVRDISINNNNFICNTNIGLNLDGSTNDNKFLNNVIPVGNLVKNNFGIPAVINN